MLVLSRKAGQVIVITTAAGEVVRVTLVKTNQRGKSSAVIGVDADKKVRIDREEIAIAKEKGIEQAPPRQALRAAEQAAARGGRNEEGPKKLLQDPLA